MHHRTKFREDRSNRSGDMADFRFFKTAISKNRKSAISPERFNVSSRNLAYDAPCAPEPDRELKFPTFENSRWRTAAILKIEFRPQNNMRWPVRVKSAIHRVGKSRIICYVIYFTYFYHLPTVNNLNFPKSKMSAAAILKNRKSAISPQRFDRSSRNLVR